MSYLSTDLLSGRGSEVHYKISESQIDFQWNTIVFSLYKSELNEVLNGFFSNTEKWYELGANMTDVKEGGLGNFIVNITSGRLTPRHASAIAAVLVKEKLLLSKGIKPIMLKKYI